MPLHPLIAHFGWGLCRDAPQRFGAEHLYRLERFIWERARRTDSTSLRALTEYVRHETAPYWAWALGFLATRSLNDWVTAALGGKKPEELQQLEVGLDPLVVAVARQPCALIRDVDPCAGWWYLWQLGTRDENPVPYALLNEFSGRDQPHAELIEMLREMMSQRFQAQTTLFATNAYVRDVVQTVLDLIETVSYLDAPGSTRPVDGWMLGYFLCDMLERQLEGGGEPSLSFAEIVGREASPGRLFGVTIDQLLAHRPLLWAYSCLAADKQIDPDQQVRGRSYLQLGHTPFGRDTFYIQVSDYALSQMLPPDGFAPLLAATPADLAQCYGL